MATTNSSGSGGGPPPAQQKLGHYRIVRQIARSNDIVYEAVDPAINRKIALKELLIPPHLAGHQRRERVERFQREAKAIGALNHTNIVTIYEIGQEGERHFIAMEFLEGPTLRDVLNLRGPLPITEALQIGIQFAEALGYAHSLGIIHRDVKPDNAHIIPPHNLVKLTDFGIARMETEPTLTSAGQIFGTPSYMSPEQIAARGLDYRSDIFSLGVVLYEMIVGRKPFVGDSVVTITYHIMNTAPAIPANIPHGIAAVLNRALSKDRDQRYQNMAALAGDLRSELLFHESPYHVGSGGFADVSPTRSNRTPAAAPAVRAPALPPAVPTAYDPQQAQPQRAAQQPASSRPTLRTSDAGANPRSMLTLALCVIGILLVLALTVWAVIAGTRAIEQGNRVRAAMDDYREGLASQTAGDTGAAIDQYAAALRLAPEGSEVAVLAKRALVENYTAQGNQQIQQGNYAAAQQSYSTAVSTDAQSADAHYGLAQAYEQQNDITDALNEYAAAAKADPFGPTGKLASDKAARDYLALADQASQSGNMTAARNDWQQVIAIDPASPMADQARERIAQASNAPDSGAPADQGIPPAQSTGTTSPQSTTGDTSAPIGTGAPGTANGPALSGPSTSQTTTGQTTTGQTSAGQ